MPTWSHRRKRNLSDSMLRIKKDKTVVVRKRIIKEEEFKEYITRKIDNIFIDCVLKWKNEAPKINRIEGIAYLVILMGYDQDSLEGDFIDNFVSRINNGDSTTIYVEDNK